MVEDSNTEAVLAVSTDDQLIRQLTERAQAQGLSLTGEDGLLRQLTKLVLEAGLEAEMTEHLGYEKHQYGLPLSAICDLAFACGFAV